MIPPCFQNKADADRALEEARSAPVVNLAGYRQLLKTQGRARKECAASLKGAAR